MKKILAGLLVVSMAAMFGCGGGGGSDSPQTTSLSGEVTFPASPAKAVAADVTVPVPTMEIKDLSGSLITTVNLTASGSNYSYSGVKVALGKDYVLKAVKGNLVLRALVNKAALTDTTEKNVNSNSSTAIIVVEKALPTGIVLGETPITAEAQTAFASTQPAAEIVQNIVAALTACTTVTSTPVTAAQAELASLANIVTAAVSSGIDPRAFVAGTWTPTTAAPATTVAATTYTVSGGAPVSSSNPSVNTAAASAITITLPRVSSANSTTFTVATAGTFTVTGNGTLSITGTLPSGVTFDAATGVLSGTPASAGTFPLTFKVTRDGLTSTQAFTLTVNPAAVTPAPTTNAVKTVLQAGLYDTNSMSFQSGTATSQEYYYLSRIGLNTSGSSLSETQVAYYDRATKTWTTTQPAGLPADAFGDADFNLTSTGWVYVADAPGNYSPVFNDDGTATLNGKVGGRSMKLAATSIDLSGQPITNASWPLVAGAGPFPAGSVGYKLTFTGLTDSYSLWASNSLPSSFTSLTQVPALGWDAWIESSSDLYYYQASLVSGGTTVDIIQQSYASGEPVKIGTGSYAITAVLGQQVLEVTIPAALRTQYRLGSNPIFGIVNGVVYGGVHEVAGVSNSEDGGFNLVAAQHLQASIDTALAKGVLAKGISKSILGW